MSERRSEKGEFEGQAPSRPPLLHGSGSEKGEFEGQAPSRPPLFHGSGVAGEPFQTASEVRLMINGSEVRVPVGTVVAAAIAIAGVHRYRRSVAGEARAPLCGMGICFECRTTIDGQPHRLSCQTVCAEGMRVITE